MAHYAFLDEHNFVTHVIPGIDEWEQIEGKNPEDWYAEFVGQPCKRTSYHGNIRYHFAGIGFFYDSGWDAFVPPRPYPSWPLNTSTFNWDPPSPYPDDGGMYQWDENTQTWEPTGD